MRDMKTRARITITIHTVKRPDDPEKAAAWRPGQLQLLARVSDEFFQTKMSSPVFSREVDDIAPFLGGLWDDVSRELGKRIVPAMNLKLRENRTA